jgi:hypothetical protein
MDDIFDISYPLIIHSDGSAGPAQPDQCSKNGLWFKLGNFGGVPPSSRNNATLLHHYVLGNDHLSVFGGTVPIFGNYDYKMYTVNLTDKNWKEIKSNG